jgi:MinD-like ATPase involved in chromosome partitioning or flagellar assembly/CheY-like chemotaxis protein
VVGKCILVVDENPASRVFLVNHLRQKQFAVLEAPTGKEGLITAWRDSPDLILFDPALHDIADQEFISKLRNDPRTGGTVLVALSMDTSPARRERCLNAGVNEYLVKATGALLALEETLARIFTAEPPTVARIKAEEPKVEEPREEGKNGLLIVFLSAKGGTGTSSLCANLAMNIQQGQPEARIVVADLVLPIGSIGQIVGAEEKINLVTVSDLPAVQTNVDYFYKNLPKPQAWQFQVLAGSPDPQQANSLKGERIGQIVEVLCSGYDLVLLDIGRALSRISLPLIQKADLILLVVSTDQSTVQLTKTVWDYLKTQGVDSRKIYAILNRAVGLEGVTKAQAEEIIGLPIQKMMPYLGGNFALANNLNQPITIKYPTDTASIIFKETATDTVKLARQLRGSSGA